MLYATSNAELDWVRSQGEVVPQLEEWTGADLMISPVQLPLTRTLLSDHLKQGACLIQVKRGHDLVASILDRRLHKSLAKMRGVGARTSQCILLFMGILQEVDGEAHINRQQVHMHGQSYWSVQTAIDEWTEHGGVYVHLAKGSLVRKWFAKKEERLQHYLQHPTREIIPPIKVYEVEPDDPLQDIIEITDWRKTLYTFPHMGPVRVNKLLTAMEEANAYPSLLTAMVWLTDRPLCVSVPGFGEAMWKDSRAWLGLNEGFSLSFDVTH